VGSGLCAPGGATSRFPSFRSPIDASNLERSVAAGGQAGAAGAGGEGAEGPGAACRQLLATLRPQLYEHETTVMVQLTGEVAHPASGSASTRPALVCYDHAWWGGSFHGRDPARKHLQPSVQARDALRGSHRCGGGFLDSMQFMGDCRSSPGCPLPCFFLYVLRCCVDSPSGCCCPCWSGLFYLPIPKNQ